MRNFLLLTLAAFFLSACGGGGGGSSTSISADVRELEFDLERSGATVSKNVLIRFNGDGVAAGFPPGIPILSALGFAPIQQGSSEVTFRISVAASLPVGEHRTTIRFATGRAGENDIEDIRTVDIPVRIVVRSVLLVQANTLSFSGRYTLPIEPELQVNVLAQGISWSASTNQPWVTLSPVNASGDSILSVGIDHQVAPPGVNSATVSVRDLATGTLRNFSVALENKLPKITVLESTGSTIGGVNGGLLSTTTARFELDGGQEADWSIRSATPWLETTISIDRLRPEASLMADTAGMTSGNYGGNYTVEARLGTQLISLTMPVNLKLQAPAFVAAASNPISFRGFASEKWVGQTYLALNTDISSYPIRLSVTGPGAAALNFPATVTVSGVSAAVNVEFDATKLSVGASSAVLHARGTVAGEPVALDIPISIATTHNRLLASRIGVALHASPGDSALSESVLISDIAEATGHAYKVSSSAAWLKASGSLRTGSNLTIQADPAGLAPGIYEAELTLTPTAKNFISTEKVRVGLAVAATAPIYPMQIAVRGLEYPQLIADPIRPYVYVLYSDLLNAPGSASIQRIDLRNGEVMLYPIAGKDFQFAGVQISPDGRELYALNYGWGPIEFRAYSLPDLRLLRSFSDFSDEYAHSSFAYARPDGRPMILMGNWTALDLTTMAVAAVPGNTEYFCDAQSPHGPIAASSDGRYAVTSTGCVFRLNFDWSTGQTHIARESMPSWLQTISSDYLLDLNRDGSIFRFAQLRDNMIGLTGLDLTNGGRELPSLVPPAPFSRFGVRENGDAYMTRLVPGQQTYSEIFFLSAAGEVKQTQQIRGSKLDDLHYQGHIAAIGLSGNESLLIWAQTVSTDNFFDHYVLHIQRYPD